MGAAELVEALQTFNPQWREGEVSPLIKKTALRRRSFFHVRRRIESLPFEVIAGPRQVGKTTLMGHLMEDLIASGHPPRNVLYAPLDSPPVALESGGGLHPVVEAYERFVLQAPLDASPRPVFFFFLDEIHSLSDWGRELKGLHDRYHPTLRVLATGSSSAAILNPPTADLPGRVRRSRIHPLKLSETLEKAHPETADLARLARDTRATLAQAQAGPDGRAALKDALRQFHAAGVAHLFAIRMALDAYALRGGYPAAQPPAGDADVYFFFEATLDTALTKDLKLYESVRKAGAFRVFLAKLAKAHGGKFASLAHATELGVDKQTPAAWLTVAEELFLVHALPQLNDGLNVAHGKAEKVFFQDPGFRAFLRPGTRLDDLERTGEIGSVMEGILFDHLKRLQFNAFEHAGGVIGYRDRPEVDFLVQLPRCWLAIELKYRGSPGGTKRLADLAQRRPDVLPLLVTRDRLDLESDVWQVPLWLMLLLA